MTLVSIQSDQAFSLGIGKIKPLVKLLANDGVKLADLLMGTGIQLNHLALYDATIQHWQYFKLIENAQKLSPDPAFALRLGEQLYINHDGLLACRVMSCQNPSQAMRLLSDYQSLLTTLFHLKFTEQSELAVFSANPLFDFEPCLPYFIEYTFASIYALGKFCTASQEFPMRYEFTHDGTNKRARYHAFFGDDIQFNCRQNRVIIPRQILAMPFIFANEDSAQKNDKLCQDKIRLVHQNTSIIEQVRQHIIKTQFADTSLNSVAAKLCMSPRTLRRHLNAENVSYKALLEKERKRLVRRQLNRPIAIKQVAAELGYSDASSFSRAFKTWFGISPQTYRAQHHT